jgi:hypothetical protein
MVHMVRLTTCDWMANWRLLERSVGLATALKCSIACGCTVERVSLRTFILHWVGIEESILTFRWSCGMFDSWRWSTWLRQTIVHKVFSCVFPFEITFWAVAFVIVDQIFAAAWKTGTFRTIWHVAADLVAILLLLFKATVTFAVVIVKVTTSGLFVVNAPSVRPTLVTFAIILVLATVMVTLLTIGHAHGHEICATTWSTTDRIPWIAVEEGWVLKHELWRGAKMLAIWRYDHCSAAHRLASLWSIVFSRGLTSLSKTFCATCGSINRMSTFASVWFHLGEYPVQSRVCSFGKIWRCATLHSLEDLFARVFAVSLASQLKTSHAGSLTIQCVTFFSAVHNLVTEKVFTRGKCCMLERERDCTLDTLTVWVRRKFTIRLTSELVSGVRCCTSASHGVTLITSCINDAAKKRAA